MILGTPIINLVFGLLVIIIGGSCGMLLFYGVYKILDYIYYKFIY